MALKFLGTIKRTKGFRGDFVISGIPKGLIPFPEGTEIGIGFSESFVSYHTLKNWKNENSSSVILIEGIKSEIEAEKLINKGVFIEEDLIKYEDDGLYLVDELIGCKVYDFITKEHIGELWDIYFTPANDIWIIKSDEGELPIPVIDDVVKKVDIKKRRIEIELIPGLIDLWESKS